ncbi:MAG: universal stress protein [Synergistaceae bacterium]|jgi:nucleotide-binding universal stress UspA family protein|nr:universal stress protein [Bacteroidia bacterium]
MLRTILAAVDIKKRDDVIANISTLDPQKVEKITLLHVIDERFGKRNISEDEKQVFEKAQKGLKELGFSVEPLILTGVPFDEIVNESKKRKVSLIVTGAGNNPKWKDFLFGETVERVLELSSLPVMVCRENDHGRHIFRHLLIGIDFSNGSYNAVKAVKSIVEHKLTEIEKITLIHVHEKTTMDILMRYAAKEQIDREISIEKDRLDEICSSLSELGIKEVNVAMPIGRPAEEIIKTVKTIGPSLIIIGAQGTGDPVMCRIGATALRIAQFASSSVLIIPTEITDHAVC